MANTMAWLGALNLLLLICATAPGHSAGLTLEQELTGGSSRAWFKRDTAAVVPGAAACATPDSFTFDTAHHLTVDRCSGGRRTSSRHEWRLDGAASEQRLRISALGLYAVGNEPDAPGATGRRLSLRPVGDGPQRGPIELQALED